MIRIVLLILIALVAIACARLVYVVIQPLVMRYLVRRNTTLRKRGKS